jgi:hypothetical protein
VRRPYFLLSRTSIGTSICASLFASMYACGSSDHLSADAGSTSDASAHVDAAPTNDGAGDASLADAGLTDANTASDATAIFGPAPPAAAAAAGFTHLVFEDDFTTESIAPSAGAASGYKWYWSFLVQSEPVPWKLQMDASAGSVADAGPGASASDAGGILTLFGPGVQNGAITTVPGFALTSPDASAPPEGQGNWKHAYFEAYLQTQIDGNPTTDQNNGWPAFWSWSVQGLKQYGYGLSTVSTPDNSEIDFFETYGTVFGQTPGNWTATMHQWPANASNDGHNNNTDSGWHTYGCLWTSTGDDQGQVRFYFDGKQVDDTVDSGTGQTQYSLEQRSQFLILGSGNGWNLNVDWVRVWQ